MLDKSSCLCCNACVSVCPKNAIKLVEYKGFLYPEINTEQCISCGLCDKVCTIEKNSLLNVYGLKNKNTDDLKKSTSGGVYMLMARHIINDGGVVYGAKDFNGIVKICRATNVSEALDFCGSKYVHCDMNNAYIGVLDDLKNNKSVLFCGTSCQINALQQFLKIKHCDTKNLITLDFICHGTPSPKMYSDFIKYVEKIRRKKIKKYHFRSKSIPWRTGVCASAASFIEYEDEKHERGLLPLCYMELFFKNIALKNACFDCPFVGDSKPSDFTMGDFWGIENENPDFYSKLGVSLLCVNTEKAQMFFDAIKDDAYIFESTKESAFRRQPNIFSSTKKPGNIEEFWNDYYAQDFTYIMKKYVNYTPWRRFKHVIKRILRK